MNRPNSLDPGQIDVLDIDDEPFRLPDRCAERIFGGETLHLRFRPRSFEINEDGAVDISGRSFHQPPLVRPNDFDSGIDLVDGFAGDLEDILHARWTGLSDNVFNTQPIDQRRPLVPLREF